MSLGQTDATLGIRAAEAVLRFLEAQPTLSGLNFRRGDDPRGRPFPCAIVMVDNLTEDWAGSDEQSGMLTVGYISGRNDDADGDGVTATEADRVLNQAAHHAAAAAIVAALKDQAGMRAFMNFGATNRPCLGFHFYKLIGKAEPGTQHDVGGQSWETTVQRKIIVADCDYA